MFHLLSRLFSEHEGPDSSRDDLIVGYAIEAVVGATDTRLRLIPNYAKKLRDPTKRSISHVRQMTQNLSKPSLLSRSTYGTDPGVHLLFGSVESMNHIIGRDPVLQAYKRDQSGAPNEDIFGLLVAERQIKHVLAMEMRGDLIERDVPKNVLMYADHRLRALSSTEEGTRRLVRIGAFHQLLQMARVRITQAKVGSTANGASTFGSDPERRTRLRVIDAFPPFDHDRRESDLLPEHSLYPEQIEHTGFRNGPAALALADYLELVIDVLSHPDRYLHQRQYSADIDRMGTLIDDSQAGTVDCDHIALWETIRPDQTNPVATIIVQFRNCDFNGSMNFPPIL
jgi:hypothetical protein